MLCWCKKIQVSLPSQLERDSNGGSLSDAAAAVSSSASSALGQSQKFSTPVHRDIQRITAPINAGRRGMQQILLVAVVCDVVFSFYAEYVKCLNLAHKMISPGQ